MSAIPGQVVAAAPVSAEGWRRWATPQVALLAVAVGYSAVVLTQVIWFTFLAHDEAVYASQFARGVPPMGMSAPRAWGMPLLLAPVDMFTTSIPVMRVYLGVLAGFGLYLAFHPWLRVASAWVAPIAAGLYVTLWTTVLFGVMGYPNLWLGFALVAGIGWAWRVLDGDSGWQALVWLVVAFGVASMIRPIDAVIVAAPTGLFLLWRRAWKPFVAVSAGLSIGVGAWVIESFLRFGDPISRLRANADNLDAGAGTGLGIMELLQLVDGPRFLCRPMERCADIHLLEVAWWLALPLLAGIGIVVARRRWPHALVTASAALLVITYAVTLAWANTRYFLPAYVLLALPVASAVLAGLRARRAVAVVVVALIIAHSATQVMTYRRVVREQIEDARIRRGEVTLLRDTLGVRAPCVLFLKSAPTLAYSTGCEARITPEPPPLDGPEVAEALAAGNQVAILLRNQAAPPTPPEGWRVERRGPRSKTYALLRSP